MIDRKFTIGVLKNGFQNSTTDSLPTILFLRHEFLSYESNVLLLRRLMRECAPGHIGDSILIEEMVYLDAAGDYAPTDAVIHSKIPGGWNLHFQSYGLCYNADIYADHIDYSLLMVPENFVPEVQHSYEYTHNLERGWHRWNHYEIKFLRRVGDAFYYRIQVGNDTFVRAKYWHGSVTFSGEWRE